MKIRIVFILICTMFLCSCGVNNDDNSDSSFEQSSSLENATEAVYHKISVEEAYDMMESTEGFILLDVRTEEEYKEKRIDGAILIPDYEIADRAESELPDKNAVILVYCRSGRRSENASKELVDMGYINVYDFGGILDWSYETISG